MSAENNKIDNFKVEIFAAQLSSINVGVDLVLGCVFSCFFHADL